MANEVYLCFRAHTSYVLYLLQDGTLVSFNFCFCHDDNSHARDKHFPFPFRNSFLFRPVEVGWNFVFGCFFFFNAKSGIKNNQNGSSDISYISSSSRDASDIYNFPEIGLKFWIFSFILGG